LAHWLDTLIPIVIYVVTILVFYNYIDQNLMSKVHMNVMKYRVGMVEWKTFSVKPMMLGIYGHTFWKLAYGNIYMFRTYTKYTSNSKVRLSINIDGIHCVVNIGSLWRFNMNIYLMMWRSIIVLQFIMMAPLTIMVSLLMDIINWLSNIKPTGLDGINAKHIIFGDVQLVVILFFLMSSILVHVIHDISQSVLY